MRSSDMAASAFEPHPLPPHMSPGIHPIPMARPQVGIERLPTRRMSNEPRESMNCKSCRKRKIKCNRLRPACEACQVFQCPCVYDAVPKKRGPKTDVLEALLKRVDGLEQRLKDQKNADPAAAADGDDASSSGAARAASTSSDDKPRLDTASVIATASRAGDISESAIYSPSPTSEPPPLVSADALLDIYFGRFHGKPYYILDETSIRQRLQANEVPSFLAHAIYAVAARYTPHPSGYQVAVKLSEDYAFRARAEIDTDEPSLDAVQALLLLVTAFTAAGKGKKAYMLLMSAVGMAMALELHRELDGHARVSLAEREVRRRLFWSCFLLDRFMACGSKRPSLISNRVILCRLPCWTPGPHAQPVEGEFFHSGSNLHYFQGSGKKSQGSSGMLIDISRILGITNRYLAAGGVKGDSHFPWHALSNLSKIRQDLDIWASGTSDVFSSLDKLFGQPDSTVLVLSKLIYHLIHCLIYRPFLPIDLVELAGTGQHQSWQIEATNMCFLHANAIAELVELGKQSAAIEWPAFVGYCICTAGTVHVHGAFYNKARGAGGDGGDGRGNGGSGEQSVFASSSDFLSREMQQLSELRYVWASVQHQRETLQALYGAHAELVKSLANNPTRYSPVFQLEDFFDRYSNIGGPGGQTFHLDSANISLSDAVVDYTPDSYAGHDLYAPRAADDNSGGSGAVVLVDPDRPSLKRRKTGPSSIRRPDLQPLTVNGPMPPHTPHSLPTPSHRHSFSFPVQHSPIIMQSPGTPMHPAQGILGSISESSAGARTPQQQHMPGGGGQPHPFSPQFSFGAGNGSVPADVAHAAAAVAAHPQAPTPGPSMYDPMFGTIPTHAFGSPAAGVPAGAASSPGARSSTASVGSGEEKDPFLSLLEQLAENEQAMGSGSELDFFLGTPAPGSGPR